MIKAKILLAKVLLLYNTVKYLKAKQVFYQLYYKLIKNKYSQNHSIPLGWNSRKLNYTAFISSYVSFDNYKFTFLNRSKDFLDKNVDWDFNMYGKLWTYNLNYFDFLNQKGFSKEIGLELIYKYIDLAHKLKNGNEPYPISLRLINWIKFISFHEIRDEKIDRQIYIDLRNLSKRIEFHLLGNHLLENAFALFIGAYYFSDSAMLKKALHILEAELEEQILPDGSHFELSPMYHQIMLWKILDCYNIAKNNLWIELKQLSILERKASVMLGWLEQVSFDSGAIPLVNDAAFRIAPSTIDLIDYASRLSVLPLKISLKESGYRMIRKFPYEMFIDIGNIGPDYIPGHAHSDTFSFELYSNGKPLIVDTGTSTYEASQRRLLERSTASHNTVQLNGQNQSQIWSSFRVAKRARIFDVFEKENRFKASIDAYESIGVIHSREFVFEENYITITDFLDGNLDGVDCVLFLHFHPDIQAILIDNRVEADSCTIKFHGNFKLEMIDFLYAPEFNKLISSKKLRIEFKGNFKTEFIFKEIVQNAASFNSVNS